MGPLTPTLLSSCLSEHSLSTYCAGHWRFGDEIHLYMIPSSWGYFLSSYCVPSSVSQADGPEGDRAEVWSQKRNTQRTCPEHCGSGKRELRGQENEAWPQLCGWEAAYEQLLHNSSQAARPGLWTARDRRPPHSSTEK